jgi:hypothetical protein
MLAEEVDVWASVPSLTESGGAPGAVTAGSASANVEFFRSVKTPVLPAGRGPGHSNYNCV